eukprot:364794-Chlamydomonas_euryale.AAC.27
MQDWSMIDFVHDSLEERAEATGRGQVVQRQRAELQRQLKNSMNEVRSCRPANCRCHASAQVRTSWQTCALDCALVRPACHSLKLVPPGQRRPLIRKPSCNQTAWHTPMSRLQYTPAPCL